MTPDTDATQSPVPGSPFVWLARLGWVLVVLYFIAAVLVLLLQYLVLPNIQAHSAAIENAVSRSIGQRVSIGQIRARWQGLHAELDMTDVRLYDKEDRVALQLPAVEAVIGWRSLVLGSLRLNSLALDHPDLHIRRDARGRVFVAGVLLGQDPSAPESSGWLLSQREIAVRDARVSWDDEMRGAPTLVLSRVNLVIQNGLFAHRFSARASAAAQAASRLDVRGEFKSNPPPSLLMWPGRLYAQFDDTDFALWQQWIDYPWPIESGRGSIRLWITLGRDGITAVTGDVAAAQVRTRFAAEAPTLDLEYLDGRLSGRNTASALSLSGRHVAFKTAGGVAVSPADFDLHWQPARAKESAEGEFQASTLQLEALSRLTEMLPVSKEMRSMLAKIDPRGDVQGIKLAWKGDWNALQHYSLRGRFSGLGVKNLGAWGGFSGASGSLDASESGGSLRLDSAQVGIDLPGLLPEPHAEFDSLTGNVAWTVARHGTDIRFEHLSFSNRDVAGILQGSYSALPRPESSRIDLTGTFPRIDARAAQRYIPMLPSGVQQYLKAAVDAGQLSDARLKLKGALGAFPFAVGKSGTFDFTANIANGEFEFSPDWPKLAAITGELRFEGPRMQILASQAAMLGARITNVRAQIADLYNGDERLRLEGQAEGPTAEFLRFIEVSPVGEHIDRATRGMSATGPGRLQLKLDLPIRRTSPFKVAGQFQFTGNQFTFDPDLPAVGQLNGRVDFTEDSIAGRNLSGQILGGPVTFSLSTRGNGTVAVEAQGTATVPGLRKVTDSAWLRRAAGSTAWSVAVTLGQGRFDVQFDSSLAGLAIELPEPFGKGLGEVLPVRVMRTNRADADFLKRARVPRLPENGDAIAVAVGAAGQLANGVFVRRRYGEDYAVQRGALGINEPAPPIEDSGITVAGSFARLDFDRWRGVFDSKEGADTDSLNSVRLNIGALVAGGKRFNEVNLYATPRGTGWNASVTARELEGNVLWQPEGRGRIVARLKRFTVPEQTPEEPVHDAAGGELPALDIAADEFVLGNKKLGRLELDAVNQARDWRIEKLLVASADGAFAASGIWQSWTSKPSVNLDFKLQLSDAGKYLARIGYPDTVKGGAATLEGKVAWLGSPQSIDYPTLTGQVRLHAGNGQFLRADPGIAKLLGILSLQSWITLDFREFFGEGFAFETISSNARIANGILSTDDFAMAGKAAQVSMSGTVDLAQETQHLRVRVVPAVGGSFSGLLTVLANPVWGLGSLVLQSVLKDPLGRIFAFEYAVSGTWSDPKVEPLRAEAFQAVNPAP